MKKYLFLGLVALIASMPMSVFAAQMIYGERANISADTIIADDVYLAGGEVTGTGTVEGDLASAGGMIIIDGTVTEDALIAGGNINILGDVTDDVRAVGGSVVIAGSVGDDVVIAAGQTHVSGKGIGGDFIWAGGVITITAPIAGNATLMGGEVYLDAPINGNVTFAGEKLTLGTHAHIGGTLTYKAPQAALIEDGAVVEGETVYTEVTVPSGGGSVPSAGMIFGFLTVAFLLGLLMKLAAALLLGLGAKTFTERALTKVHTRPLVMMWYGLVTLILAPVVLVLIMATGVGVLIGLFGFLLYALLVLLSVILGTIVCGTIIMRLFRKGDGQRASWKVITLGVVVFSILGVIPFVGWIITFALMLVALGAVVHIGLAAVKAWR